MKSRFWTLTAVFLVTTGLSISAPLFAQPPGFRGGDDRGGERGGDRGGRERGSWGDRGGERGGERGSWGGDRGGERGGPPGGFGGGPPGGFGGGPPGGRGGFDPSSFLERMDRNGNGMIDPDEMEGPAQMMIARLQREDPSIRTDRPIPISKIREAFDRMRGGGDSGGSRDSSGRSDREREDSRAKLNEALTPALLVPGFGEPQVVEPVKGFGPAAELLSVEVRPADLKSAEELLQRYDRDKDGFLSGEEISSRWSGNPMDFDRNGDGKLSLSELSVRAARMRVAQAEVRAPETRRGDDRRRDRGDRPAEVPDPYNGRRSFATTSRELPKGLPAWFTEKDVDGDQQVSMAEYSSQWTASLVEEFQSFDLNGDGVITVQECLAAIRNGASGGGGGGSSMASSSRSSGSSSTSSSGSGRGGSSMSGSRGGYGSRSGASSSRSSGESGSSASSASTPAGQLDQKMIDTAQRIIARTDKNKDGVLTPDEWKDMLMDVSAADANKDGRITVEEYAQWLHERSKR